MSEGVGTLVSHYRLVEKLGEGGFGTVYRGVHTAVPTIQVAVKIAHSYVASDPTLVRLLRQECELLSGLTHPGVVAFRDLIVDLDRSFIAVILELLEGVTLLERMRQGPLPIDELAGILSVLLDTMAYAHAKGVVHRDIKPENVFLCADGRVKLMDFGIAKVVQASKGKQSALLKGTLAYMAPERFSNRSIPASDLYSLGLVAWEAIAGEQACPAGDIAVATGWHLSRGARDLRERCPDCPAWLAGYIARLTHRDDRERPLDAGEAARLFRDLRNSVPLRAVELADEIDLEVTDSGRQGFAPRSRTEPDSELPPAHELPIGSLESDSNRAFQATSPSGGWGMRSPYEDSPGAPSVEPPVAAETRPQRSQRWILAIAGVVALFLFTAGLLGALFSLQGLRNASRPVTARPAVSSQANDAASSGQSEAKVVLPESLRRRPEDDRTQPGVPVPYEPDPELASQAQEPPGEDPMEHRAPGLASLQSEPTGARVFLNGEPFGRTPMRGTEMPAGHHVLTLQKPGYKSISREIDVPVGGRIDLNPMVLVSDEGSKKTVRVLAPGVPPASRLYIDGGMVGDLPVELSLTEGEHSFRVQPRSGQGFVLTQIVTFEDYEKLPTITLQAP